MAVQAIMPFVHCTVNVGAATKAYHVVWKFLDGFSECSHTCWKILAK